jgi:hypothetical protein
MHLVEPSVGRGLRCASGATAWIADYLRIPQKGAILSRQGGWQQRASMSAGEVIIALACELTSLGSGVTSPVRQKETSAERIVAELGQLHAA